MAEYNKVYIRGTLPGNEVFSVGFAFAEPVGDGDSVASFTTQADMQQFLGSWQQNMNATALPALYQALSEGGAVTGLRCEWRENNTLLSAVERSYAAPEPGVGPVRMVNQCAAVLSLLSPRAGRSYRGRIYWPYIGGTIDSDTSKMESPSNAALVGSWATFLNYIIDQGTTDNFALGVYSSTLQRFTPVNLLQVGDVVDTQRRRRDNLIEQRATAPLF